MARKTDISCSHKPIPMSSDCDIVILEKLHSKQRASNDDTHPRCSTHQCHHIWSLILLAVTIGLAISMFNNMRSEQSNDYGSWLNNNKDDSSYHNRYYIDEYDGDKKGSTGKLNFESDDDNEWRLEEWDHSDDHIEPWKSPLYRHKSGKSKSRKRSKDKSDKRSKSKSDKRSKSKSDKHEKSKSDKHGKSKSDKHGKSKSDKHSKSKSDKHSKSKSGKHGKSKSDKRGKSKSGKHRKSGIQEFSSSFDSTSSESWSSSFDSTSSESWSSSFDSSQ